jgi:hypothetical protein
MLERQKLLAHLRIPYLHLSPEPPAPSAHRLLRRCRRASVERAAAARRTAACGAALEPLADLGGRGRLW